AQRGQRLAAAALVALDEDALPGTFLGSFDHRFFEVRRHGGHAGRSARVVLYGAVFLHVGKAIVEKSEHGRRNLLAQSIACAEILVDPDLHVVVSLLGSDRPTGQEDRSEATPAPSTSRGGA